MRIVYLFSCVSNQKTDRKLQRYAADHDHQFSFGWSINFHRMTQSNIHIFMSKVKCMTVVTGDGYVGEISRSSGLRTSG